MISIASIVIFVDDVLQLSFVLTRFLFLHLSLRWACCLHAKGWKSVRFEAFFIALFALRQGCAFTLTNCLTAFRLRCFSHRFVRHRGFRCRWLSTKFVFVASVVITTLLRLIKPVAYDWLIRPVAYDRWLQLIEKLIVSFLVDVVGVQLLQSLFFIVLISMMRLLWLRYDSTYYDRLVSFVAHREFSHDATF